MALIRPMVPMEIRSSRPVDTFSNRRAIYTTRRRLCSTRVCFAPSSPRSSAARAAFSSSPFRGGGRVSLPPM